MRLADDDRGRVPFALVGVLLLVGSATLGVSLLDDGRRGADLDADAAMNRGDAAAQTALRSAVADASRRAAAEPVLEPADTPYGRAINDTEPFRDYLRIRIYLAVRDRLAAVDERVRSVRVRASLPPVTNESTLRAAKRRVSVERGGEGRIRVAVRNVSLVAARNGERIASGERSLRATVPTPALLLHDRVERYEERLNRGALDGAGFGRRFTARLYAMAWARGYAQYGGGPISNVVGNRHVELAANGAALETQRAVFGRADPAGRAGLARGTARVGLTDALAGSGVGGQEWVDYVLGNGDPPTGSVPGRVAALADRPSASTEMTVGVNRTADAATYDLLAGGDGERTLETVLDDAYAVDARLVTNVRPVYSEVEPPSEPDGEGWVLNDTERRRTYEVAEGSAVAPSLAEGYHELATYSRVVAETTVVHREWVRENETATTVDRRTTRYRVGLRVAGSHSAGELVPDRPVAGVHREGGALDGPNHRAVASRATRKLVTDRGGASALARRAVADGDAEAETRLAARQPDALGGWVYRDLMDLRERVRNVSVAVERGAMGTSANPPAELAATLRDRRAALVDAPDRYDGVADRARVAARAAYVDRTIARLERQADAVDETQSEFGDALGRVGAVTDDRLDALVDARDAVTRPGRHLVRADGGAVAVRVNGAPSYLTVAGVDADRLPAVTAGETYHPLAARNVNAVTVPYGDAADRITGKFVDDTTRVDLRTAARTLHETNRILAVTDDAELADRRDELREAVEPALDSVTAEAATELAAATTLEEGAAHDAAMAGLRRWDSTGARALAMANGSAAGAIADAAAARGDTPDGEAWRDRVRTRLAVATTRASDKRAVRPPEGPVRDAADHLRGMARDRIQSAVEQGLENASERVTERLTKGRSAVPAGVPVTPVPGYWYATANAWQVNVSGEYARFTVRTGRAAPTAPGGTVAYSRDGSTVTLDVDGDGSPDRLGRATRVSFDAETTVLVVVPPGKSGVGDVDGQRTEESPGWPDAGTSAPAM
ncbi:hypothetical protein G9464_07555 [Halostella sp. JP-L12]|uniref:DUF7286 family protein n=1 Tax=Halostella TaxID=1843185 RepID=UPI000EF7E268|nr:MULTISPECIES: hypothetical protein [Halostella]NHN47450.1 hypothetical protein [Halostella sp. JP-L12]